MRIGELARRAHTSTSAVRFYEKVGVLSPPRRVSGRRDYADQAVDELRFLLALQRAGFTLAELRKLRPWSSENDAGARWHEELRRKLAELDAKIEALRAARAALAASADCACAGEADRCLLVHRASEQSARSNRTARRRGRT